MLLELRCASVVLRLEFVIRLNTFASGLIAWTSNDVELVRKLDKWSRVESSSRRRRRRVSRVVSLDISLFRFAPFLWRRENECRWWLLRRKEQLPRWIAHRCHNSENELENNILRRRNFSLRASHDSIDSSNLLQWDFPTAVSKLCLPLTRHSESLPSDFSTTISYCDSQRWTTEQLSVPHALFSWCSLCANGNWISKRLHFVRWSSNGGFRRKKKRKTINKQTNKRLKSERVAQVVTSVLFVATDSPDSTCRLFIAKV